MAKSFDFKKLMLQQGERIGLGVAAGIAGLLILTNLGSLFGTGPYENAEKLKKKAEGIETLSRTNMPREGSPDLPPKSKETLEGFAFQTLRDPGEFGIPYLFDMATRESSGRQQPQLLSPVEGTAIALFTQVKTFIFRTAGDSILVKVLKDGSKDTNKELKTLGNNLAGRRGGPAMGMGMNFNGQNLQDPKLSGGTDSTRPELGSEWVKQELLDSAAGKPAETIRPLRMAMIVASFPYRQQLEEFKNKLRLASIAEVLQEMSQVPNEASSEMQQMFPSFCFLGVDVERRLIDALGNPLNTRKGKDGWELVDLNTTYKPLVMLAGRQTQKDDARLEPIKPKGLVMPRLRVARGENVYPSIETELPTIKKTLDSLIKSDAVMLPNRFSDKFDIFNTDDMPTTGTGTPNPMGRPAGESGTSSEAQYPEHCLIRLIDVTVKPGAIYQYRIKPRMVNPNFGRNDLASSKYADKKELESDKWFIIPQKVVVPSELEYYLVDQKELDPPRSYQGMNFDYTVSHNKQVVFQIHHWLENASGTREFTPVGEWLVAERVPVYKGEYIGRTLKAEVPLWQDTRDAFVLVTKASPRDKQGGMEVNFAHPSNEDVLVDFEGGTASYKRSTGDTKPVDEKCAVEALVFSSDGKLLAHNSAQDANSEARRKRLQDWKLRIEEVRRGQNMPGGGTTPATPFGK